LIQEFAGVFDYFIRKFLRFLDVADLARPFLDIDAKLSYLLISRFFRVFRLLSGVSGV